MTPRSSERDVLAVFEPVAARYKTVIEHWVGGERDQSESYCLRCCERLVREIKKAEPERDVYVDGGWTTENDGMRFCCNDKCARALTVTFTDYAVESELQTFGEYPFDPASPSDCYSLLRMLGATSWKGHGHSRAIRRVAFRAFRLVPVLTRQRRIRRARGGTGRSPGRAT